MKKNGKIKQILVRGITKRVVIVVIKSKITKIVLRKRVRLTEIMFSFGICETLIMVFRSNYQLKVK